MQVKHLKIIKIQLFTKIKKALILFKIIIIIMILNKKKKQLWINVKIMLQKIL